ncbi:MAG TPA: right-handed parallel beta-helix repeat-containing protein [Mucilaginibacter sp.]|nr:right-handed parallel beta-helix repeat-containing protein [Mucilaginibacter sp.]
MKNIILLILLLFSLKVNARTYYFSTQYGDDRRSKQQAQNPATPWKTLKKLNSFFPSLKPGDMVLLKRNDVFYGQIIVAKSGTSSRPITIGAYGAGAKPVVTGFITVSKWTDLGANIWESTSAVSSSAACNMVVINGSNTAMGRYPNSGYLSYQAHNADKSITSNGLSGTNWTGAEVVIRKNHYIIDRSNITSQAGTILDHGPTSTYAAQDGFGLFIQNDSRTLDTLNEWYYNPVNGKLRVYSYGVPSNVQVSTVDTLVYMFQQKYLTFDGLEFRGSNVNTIYAYWVSHVTVQNCSFNFAGSDAIGAYLSSYISIVKSSFNNTNNDCIKITSWDYTPLPTNHILISEDTIKNTAVLTGMGNMVDDQSERCAIFLVGSNNTVEKCVIDSTGYIPIWWAGNSSLVQNNVITNFCFVKDDGGGIWTWNNNIPFVVFKNQRVLNNVVLNGIGALPGSIPDIFTGASGIYCDCNSANIEISGNTVANCNRNGILIHDSHEISVRNNTLYNNAFQITLFSDTTYTDDADKVSLLRNIAIRGNIFVAKTPQQMTLAGVTYKNDLKQIGAIDSNCYARPIDDNLTIETVNSMPSWAEKVYDLKGWQQLTAYDNYSYKSPIAIKDVSDIDFEYNTSDKSKTVSLSNPCIDVKGKIYSGKLTLDPYCSVVLLYMRPGSDRVKQNPPKSSGGQPVVY